MDAWQRWYPPEFFPSLWANLDHLVREQRLLTSDEVLHELERKTDDLHLWVKERKQICVALTDEVQGEVAAILGAFPTLVDSRTGKSFADPFVIATAKVTSTIVVTGERPTGAAHRPKIPDVCNHYGVEWISIVELIRRERWKF
jgi:hypothetical protein